MSQRRLTHTASAGATAIVYDSPITQSRVSGRETTQRALRLRGAVHPRTTRRPKPSATFVCALRSRGPRCVDQSFHHPLAPPAPSIALSSSTAPGPLPCNRCRCRCRCSPMSASLRAPLKPSKSLYKGGLSEVKGHEWTLKNETTFLRLIELLCLVLLPISVGLVWRGHQQPGVGHQQRRRGGAGLRPPGLLAHLLHRAATADGSRRPHRLRRTWTAPPATSPTRRPRSS